jgi:hypothetical protein
LSGLDDKQAAVPTQEGDAPDWLSGLDDKQAAEPTQEGDVPDWLSGLDAQGEQPPQKAATVESLGSTSQEQDDAVAWLESLAAKHGAKPEELVTDPTKRSETPPEWVSQAQSLGDVQSAPAVDAEDQKPEVVEHALNIGEQFFADAALAENEDRGLGSRDPVDEFEFFQHRG